MLLEPGLLWLLNRLTVHPNRTLSSLFYCTEVTLKLFWRNQPPSIAGLGDFGQIPRSPTNNIVGGKMIFAQSTRFTLI